jgi:hypothetical protein
MQIKFTNGLEKHLPRDVAESFIASGAAIAMPSKRESCVEAQARVAAKSTVPNVFWSVRPAQITAEHRYEPQIYGHCGGCNADLFVANPRKMVSSVFRHAASCGFVTEAIPASIAAEYSRLRDEFYPVRSFVAVAKDALAELRENLKMGVAQ